MGPPSAAPRGPDQPTNRLTGAAPPAQVAYNDDDTVLVSAGYDQSLRCWDCRSQSIDPIQVLPGFRDSVTSVCVREHVILGGSVDGTVRAFDVRVGQQLTDDLQHPITCVRLSRDGQCVLASCLDATCRLLDRDSGELLAEYRGHQNAGVKVECGLTYTDGHVVGGSEDGRVLFWELVEAEVVAELPAHPGKIVCSLDCHPSEGCMVTAGTDGFVKVWKAL